MMDVPLLVGSTVAIAGFLWAGRPGEHPLAARLAAAGVLLAWIAGVTALSFLDTQSQIGSSDVLVRVSFVAGFALPGIVGLVLWRGGTALALRWMQLLLFFVPIGFLSLAGLGLVGLVLVAPWWAQLEIAAGRLSLVRWAGAAVLVAVTLLAGSDAVLFGASVFCLYVASLQRVERAASDGEAD